MTAVGEHLPHDHLDPEFAADPVAAYQRLREIAPVLRADRGYWLLTRHDDCVAMLRDPRYSHENPQWIAADHPTELLRRPKQLRAVRDDPSHSCPAPSRRCSGTASCQGRRFPAAPGTTS